MQLELMGVARAKRYLAASLPEMAPLFDRTLGAVQTDPRTALLGAERILTRLLRDRAIEVGVEPPLDVIEHAQFSATVGRRIMLRLQSVRDLGQLAAEQGQVECDDAHRALSDLCAIISWFNNGQDDGDRDQESTASSRPGDVERSAPTKPLTASPLSGAIRPADAALHPFAKRVKPRNTKKQGVKPAKRASGGPDKGHLQLAPKLQGLPPSRSPSRPVSAPLVQPAVGLDSVPAALRSKLQKKQPRAPAKPLPRPEPPKVFLAPSRGISVQVAAAQLDRRSKTGVIVVLFLIVAVAFGAGVYFASQPDAAQRERERQLAALAAVDLSDEEPKGHVATARPVVGPTPELESSAEPMKLPAKPQLERPSPSPQAVASPRSPRTTKTPPSVVPTPDPPSGSPAPRSKVNRPQPTAAVVKRAVVAAKPSAPVPAARKGRFVRQLQQKRDDQCHRAVRCRQVGACAWRSDQCVAASRDDCLQSLACRRHGKCSMREGVCVALEDSDCELSNDCAAKGHCRSLLGICKALTSVDCQRSRLCKTWGACRFEGGACVANNDVDCEASIECRRLARCSVQGSVCVVSDTADCKLSARCTESGLCTFSGGKCVAKSDEDCAKSSNCRAWKRCKAKAGVCTREQ